MSEQSEALRLADELDTDGRPGGLCGASATVLRRQHSRIEADEALMRTGLQSLEESIDIVRQEYLTDWRHGIPTRKAQLDGIKETFDRHEAAITALRKRLESSNG